MYAERTMSLIFMLTVCCFKMMLYLGRDHRTILKNFTASTLLISGHARQASTNVNKEGRERGGRKEEADTCGPCPHGVYNLEIN